jgi:spermidine synthase
LEFDDGGEQTCIDLDDPERVVHEYLRFMVVGLLFVRDDPRTLMVGLGGGATPRVLLPHVPGLRMDVVELNPVVARVAHDFFGVQESERLKIHLGDGRKFMEESKERWDLVMLDAYGSAAIPFPLATTEFFRAVAERVEPTGAVVSNIWYRNDKLFRAMVRTIHEQFPAMYVFKGKESVNGIVVATRQSPAPTCQTIQQRAKATAKGYGFRFDFEEAPARCEPIEKYDLASVPVLRDANQREFDALGEL